MYDFFIDENGIKWVTLEGGIAKYTGFGFTTYPTKSSFTHLAKLNGKIYAFNSLGEILVWNGEAWERKESENFKPIATKLLGGVHVQNNILYISTVQGNHVFYTKDLQSFDTLSVPTTARYNFLDNDTLTISWTNNSFKNDSLQVISNGNTNIFQFSSNTSFSQVRAEKLKSGAVLLALGQEVIIIKGDKLLSRNFLDNVVETVMEDREEKIWLGLLGDGLINFAGSNLHESNRVHYLSGNNITDIDEDEEGNIWVCTMGKGIEMMAVPLILNYDAPIIFSTTKDTIKKTIPTKLKIEDKSEEMAQFIYTPTPTYKGIGGVYCTGVKIHSRDTSILKKYELDYDQNFIKINFGAITKANVPVNYRYKMDGLENKWNYTSSSYAYYTSLPQGNFKFIVQASGADGIWSDNEDSIQFIIKQPFWRNIWFYIVGSFLIIVFILIFVWWRLKKLKAKQASENALNKKIAHLELNALRAQMNPHFVFNAMNSIQHFIASNDQKNALKMLNDFSKILRATLENSRKSKIRMEDEIKMLNLYLKIESIRFGNQFDYTIEIDDQIDIGFDEIPPMIIQPFVENAIKHGLLTLNGERKGKVEIFIHKVNEDLICIVRDNGVGRDVAAKNNIGKADKPKSQGMQITSERLEVIGNLYNRKVSVEVKDLKDENNNPCGTEVIIKMPYQKDEKN